MKIKNSFGAQSGIFLAVVCMRELLLAMQGGHIPALACHAFEFYILSLYSFI
ncbi:MAG TPA: hypothetical protein PKE57_07855 [Cellvibrionaceae bacterium]|nr:hypothetical protein [Cellvibrionaceae bacterium]HMW50270.1 hypothetical protein [Cellvibrionaceae bacterium]HMW72807.1 hypothetical protein [Cellvibrionaceae bacterium]HNG60963.1 hypothetical protein [Cellvibrionaceae bacterium]